MSPAIIRRGCRTSRTHASFERRHGADRQPAACSAIAAGLLRQLSVDPVAVAKTTQRTEIYASLNLGPATFFDKETFGTDRLVASGPAREDGEAVDWQHFLNQTPLPHRSKQDILRIETGNIDYFPDRNSAQKKDMLSRMSYGDFLSKIAKIDVFRVHASQCVLAGWNMMIP